jgi:Domain of unknown function (DUF4602)
MIKTKASLNKDKQLEKEFKIIKLEGLKRLPSTKPPQIKNEFDKFKTVRNSNSDDEFEAIFGDFKPKRKKSSNEITYESARREVMNFGIAGSKEKSNYTKQLLIKLGAKKPKNTARNYKEILNEKQQQKLEESKINKRAIFGTSHSLQYRNQRKVANRDDGLLKKYGKIDKANKKNIKQKFMK